MNNALVVIPAIKKRVAFPDDLIKKIGGITLIQRAINKSKEFSLNICVVTDSEEIKLISERSNVDCYYDKSLNPNFSRQLIELYPIFKNIIKKNSVLICLSPYCPMLKSSLITEAYDKFILESCNIMVTTTEMRHPVFNSKVKKLNEVLSPSGSFDLIQEGSLMLISSDLVNDPSLEVNIKGFCLKESFEIRSYQDWWICEKILNRRKILFNIVGNVKVGTGHVFRALSIAHEITDHQVAFVCNLESVEMVQEIVGDRYIVYEESSESFMGVLSEYSPDLVINDILNTDEKFIQSIKEFGARVVNFEDLGRGALFADLVFNELYDVPLLEGDNIFWGRDYLFIRDEFDSATPNTFSSNVTTVLLAFGGVDPSNYTLKSLKKIVNICASRRINIRIVVGIGYQHLDGLLEYIKNHDYDLITVVSGTGVMSMQMEDTDLAIVSNGRTVYELAHMNIPSIILSHHSREESHSFGCEDTGFVNFGQLSNDQEESLSEVFSDLVSNENRRRVLFNNIVKYSFIANKEKVINLILKLIQRELV